MQLALGRKIVGTSVTLRQKRRRCGRLAGRSTAVHLRVIGGHIRHLARHRAAGHAAGSRGRGGRRNRAEPERKSAKQGDKQPDHAHEDSFGSLTVNEHGRSEAWPLFSGAAVSSVLPGPLGTDGRRLGLGQSRTDWRSLIRRS